MYEKFSAGTDIITYPSQKVEEATFLFFVHFEEKMEGGIHVAPKLRPDFLGLSEGQGSLPVVSCGFG